MARSRPACGLRAWLRQGAGRAHACAVRIPRHPCVCVSERERETDGQVDRRTQRYSCLSGSCAGRGGPGADEGEARPKQVLVVPPAPARGGTRCWKGLPSLSQLLPGCWEHRSAWDPPTAGGSWGSCSHKQRELGCQGLALVMTSRGQWALWRGPEQSSLRDSGAPHGKESRLLGPADTTHHHGAGGVGVKQCHEAVTVL